MSKLSALIAEDEAPQRRELRAALEQLWPELQIAAECSSGLEALEALAQHSPQVAFLDIRMPGLSGLEVARAASASAHIVFTTAYEQYAVEAFEQGAVDYLLKPVKRERLALTVKRLREKLSGGAVPDISGILNALQDQLAKQARRDGIRWITAGIGNTTKLFPIEDILFFRADEKYTRVVTATDEAHIRSTLKELSEALDPEEFWQVHRSAIVRVSAIQSVHRDDAGRLTLKVRGHAETVPVSQALHGRFRGM